MLRFPLSLLFALGAATASHAGDLVTCKTSLRGEVQEFAYDPDSPALKESRGLREKLANATGEITCPGLVTLRALTPELTDADRGPFCLQWDGKLNTYLGYDLGARDAYLSCRTVRKQFCQRVSASKQAAGKLGQAAKGLAVDAGTEAVLGAAGVAGVQGPATLIAEHLISLGATAVQGVGATAALGAVAVTAVAVGGAIYVCSDDGAAPAALQPAPLLKPGEVAPGSELPKGEAIITVTPVPAPQTSPSQTPAPQTPVLPAD